MSSDVWDSAKKKRALGARTVEASFQPPVDTMCVCVCVCVFKAPFDLRNQTRPKRDTKGTPATQKKAKAEQKTSGYGKPKGHAKKGSGSSFRPSAQSTTTKVPSQSGRQSLICWKFAKCGATRFTKTGRSCHWIRRKADMAEF